MQNFYTKRELHLEVLFIIINFSNHIFKLVYCKIAFNCICISCAYTDITLDITF